MKFFDLFYNRSSPRFSTQTLERKDGVNDRTGDDGRDGDVIMHHELCRGRHGALDPEAVRHKEGLLAIG